MSKLSELALEWVGTPWVHNQSKKHLGCDCVGFLIGLGREANLIPKNFYVPNYHRIPRFNSIIDTIEKIESLYKVDEPYDTEDILIIRYGELICHVALYLGNHTIIHADNLYGVHVVPINFFKDKIFAIYRIKEEWRL
jgi:cell wall-associated NlpC family hydrolase